MERDFKSLAIGALGVLGGAAMAIMTGNGTMAVLGALALGAVEAGAQISAESLVKAV